MTCGIYSIQHLASGRRYIGQSRNIEMRWKQYLAGDTNPYMSRAVAKYGWAAFLFEILEECVQDQLNEREIWFIESYKCIAPLGFNLRGGGNQMSVLSPEARRNVTEANRRKVKEPAWIENHTKAMRLRAKDPDWLKKQKLVAADPGVNRRRSKAANKQHADPEWRARWLAGIRNSVQKRKGVTKHVVSATN